ncbi:helix-turn-helix domain-containing protein [Cupriavidus taiwanensis]|uniref:TetR/AcrR family transcriptional regulator n=1 Tax=Cupriavidus taiwanensis TaxID=164546 RepID=UPI000E16093F|nr:TetR/AcrR family transcriptional regulator [Cupriavidus taiwanensis]SOZ31377.1 putative transcriptional regulator, TetR family [Cupriavidus taiwanensis]SPA35838.1 putative transcriptional regulator, TetR family [Cupriavidus taiwanensis]
MATPSARDRILDTAARLFYQEGYRATGIDRIIAESGVAKMSLYRHFASKNALIAAFLARRHDEWMAWFRQQVETRLAERPRLDVIADALADWFERDFRGCAFINVVAEAGDAEAHQQAAAHKARLEAFVADIAARLGLRDPQAVAAEAMLCIEGMIVRYQVQPDRAVVEAGRRLLGRLQGE